MRHSKGGKFNMAVARSVEVKLSGQSVFQARLKVGMALQRLVTYSNAATCKYNGLGEISQLRVCWVADDRRVRHDASKCPCKMVMLFTPAPIWHGT
jgi:hypothetical protein